MEVVKGIGDIGSVIMIQSEVFFIPNYKCIPHWTESIFIFEQMGFGVVGMFLVSRVDGKVVKYDCLLAR